MNRILLADDSPHAQRMGEQILSGEGFEVVTVSDGDSALVRLDDVNPDLVLADVMMPKRSGYEICQYVKISPRHRHTRVLLTAGAEELVDDAECKRAGADGVVRKPFEASLLIESVKPLIELAASERGQSAARPRATPASAGRPATGPIVAVMDPEQIRAAVTLALEASIGTLIEEITDKVITALSAKPGSRAANSQ